MEPVVHSQGRVVLNSITEIPPLDLNVLEVWCNQNTFSNGPGDQGIEKVYVGPDQVVAKLFLPDSVLDTKNQYILHPGIMKAALQASLGLTMEPDALKPVVPLALEELEIFGNCSSTMWAVIQYSDCVKATKKQPKIDIDLCDEHGTVWVRMKGYSARVLESEMGLLRASAIGAMMLKISWQEQMAVPETLFFDYARRLVICCEMEGISPESIENGMNGARCLSLQSKQKDVDKRFQAYAIQVFEEIQTILRDKFTGKVLIQLVVLNQGEHQLCSGLSGLLKTAWLENPKLIGQIIEVDPTEDTEGIVEKLKENARVSVSRDPFAQQIRYQDGKRYIAGWSEVDTFPEETSEKVGSIPWKMDGVYLITGGAGGLGRIFAREIARKAKGVTLILTGRSPFNEEKQAQIKELEAIGARIRYRQADVVDKKAVESLIQSIREEFGRLHGIIHGAGIIKDNFIIKKTTNEFLEVLEPKVAGLMNLDLASKDLELEFFIIFSSISGSLGNPGQADYAAANAFMGAYAKYRNALVAVKQRQGLTLSINWPLWKEGTMHIDAVTERLMTQNTGMVAMGTRTGIQALYRALASGEDQVLVMAGELAKMRSCLLGDPSKVQLQPMQSLVPALAPEQFREKIIHQLKILFGEIIKLSIAKIDSDEPLESYGIDSIMINRLNQKLAGIFSVPGYELSKTLFYEYQTLGTIAEYLIAEHSQECMKWMGFGAKVQEIPVWEIPALSPGAVDFKAEFPVLSSMKTSKKSIRNLAVMTHGKETREPIAIIGISGHYPQARGFNHLLGEFEPPEKIVLLKSRETDGR